MGLDRPLPVQFQDYLAGIMRLNLGTSFNTGQPVVSDLRVRLPATMELALWSTSLRPDRRPVRCLVRPAAGSARDVVVSGVAIFAPASALLVGLIVLFIFYAVLKVSPLLMDV